MPSAKAHLWHYAPFLRLLIPLVIGIIIQWYFPVSISILLISACFSISVIALYFFLPDRRKYQLSTMNGLVIHLLLFTTGACLVWLNDIRHEKKWIGNMSQNKYLVVRLLEPFVEKQNSYKALAEVTSGIHEGKAGEVK